MLSHEIILKSNKAVTSIMIELLQHYGHFLINSPIFQTQMTNTTTKSVLDLQIENLG